MTTMEESGEFRVTRHNGISATSETGTLLCTANDELPARRYYQTGFCQISGQLAESATSG
jgi:hypothetical protein